MDSKTYEERKKLTSVSVVDGKQYQLDHLYTIYESETDLTTIKVIDYLTGLIKEVTYNLNSSVGVIQYESGDKDLLNLPMRKNDVKNIVIKSIKGLRKLVVGVNDFESWCRSNDRLDLLAEYSNTNPKKPDEITKGAIDKVHWVCQKCGNEWDAIIKTRTTASRVGCPMCKYREGKYHITVTGDNDLETYCKKNGLENLLREYSPNNVRKPNKISYGNASEKVEWICSKCGNVYMKLVENRIKGQGCPKCSTTGNSIPDMTISRYYLELLGEQSVGYRIKIDKYEADVILRESKTIIDYRGAYWHENKKDIDKIKEELFKGLGYKQVIIWGDPPIQNKVTEISESIIRIDFDTHDYEWLLNTINSLLGIDESLKKPDIEEIQRLVVQSKNNNVAENNITITNPEVAERWDYERNGTFLPESVTRGTKYKAWFICKECGRPYYAYIRKQCNGQGCSFCKNVLAYTGINDIVTTNPDILKLIDRERSNITDEDLMRMKSDNHIKKFYITCPICDTGSSRAVCANELSTEGYRCKYCGEILRI